MVTRTKTKTKPKAKAKAKPKPKAKAKAKPKPKPKAKAKPTKAQPKAKAKQPAPGKTATASTDPLAALAADLDAVPAVASPHLQAVEELLARLPRPIPKRSGTGNSEVPPMFLHEGLRTALLRLIQRSRASWTAGEDYGLVNTLVGRLEQFPAYKRSELRWHK